jgi:mono/diheme cytochrome c family protein
VTEIVSGQRDSRLAVVSGALLLGVGLGLVAGQPLAVAQRPDGSTPPFALSEPKPIEEGARLFRQSCTGYCHGKDGGPARAPKLRGHKLEQRHVYARIAKGSPNGMPGFESTLPPDSIWKLVAYVLSLSNAKDQ